MKKFVSLGFSCQSRFTLDSFRADQPSMPYDWCITTKTFVLQSLESMDGREFTPSIDELELYEMSVDKTQGLGKSGVWFWHDFSRNGHLLTENWKSEANYLAKYPILWQRFLTLLRDASQEKVFVISNSQSNLDQFATSDEDFSLKFGMNSEYLDELTKKLDAAGAINYKLIVLLRSLQDYIDIVSKSRLYNIDPRFVGSLSLPFHKIVAESLLQQPTVKSNLDCLVGHYDNGVQIIHAPFDSLIILDANKFACGVAKSFSDGYVFSFAGGINFISYAVEDGGYINFANKTKWRRLHD